MLIQMPVFIGFFTMIRSAIELRGAHFLWVGGFVQAGHAVHDSGPVTFPFNLLPLPLLMGGAMVWQAHLQPPSPGMDPRSKK
jgi:YidC/Oxa1 family membrane protein insertase